MKISSSFDGGCIDIVSIEDTENIILRLRPDAGKHSKQWFYFRLQGGAYQRCVLKFIDISDDIASAVWEDYQALASYDRVNWFRVPTYYQEGCLTIEHMPLANSIYYAYFEPYTYEQHLNLLGDVQSSGLCQITDLGSTPEGRDINLLTIGNQVASDVKVWVVARQHAGETMGEWFIEGLLSRLLDFQDATARALLDKATFYVVPNINPDGTCHGYFKSNAQGVDLNTQWEAPNPDTAPEVYYVREKMIQEGVDIFLNIGGEDMMSYVLVSGAHGVPNYSEQIASLENGFISALKAACPDVQDDASLSKTASEATDLSLATQFVGNTFKCLSLTISMPFKDNILLPDDDFGWSAQRSLRLGESTLSAILNVCHHIDDISLE